MTSGIRKNFVFLFYMNTQAIIHMHACLLFLSYKYTYTYTYNIHKHNVEYTKKKELLRLLCSLEKKINKLELTYIDIFIKNFILIHTICKK